MKKLFNNETCPSRILIDVAAIHVTVNSLMFNPEAVRLLGLTESDSVVFEQEDDKFYLRFDPDYGFPLKSCNKTGLKISRVSLRRALHRAVGHPRFRFEIGEQKQGRFPLTVITYDKK